MNELHEINIRDFPEILEKLPWKTRMKIIDVVRYVRHRHPDEITFSASDIQMMREALSDLGYTSPNHLLIDNTVIIPPEE